MNVSGPIGVFDSGYGGLTVLKEIVDRLPQYDYLYLGDNARSPYGARSFETVYRYTLDCVNWLFKKNCSLVILACNTASAKALRTIQQTNLPKINSYNRVLGVIRPTAEVIGNFTKTNSIGILGTNGTIQSGSYVLEINKFFPGIKIYQQSCPLWVSLIENNEYENAGADYFIKKNIDDLLNQSKAIDTILLACTHYPLLIQKISQFISSDIKIISQGGIVAESLDDYLYRHPETEERCSRNEEIELYTTDSAEDFNTHSSKFFGRSLLAKHVEL
jgi:glutamate racemase